MEPDFFHFLKFGSLVFLEIAYSESLQQCLASSTGKIHEKYFCAQISVERAKIRPKTGFFPIFSSVVYQFFLKLHTMIACNNLQHLLEVKSMEKKKKIGTPNFGQVRPKTRFFCHFLKFGSLVFLGKEYNDSLQQFLTPSGVKIHKKIFGAKTSFFFFFAFSQVWFISFPCNCIQCSLQQYITSNRGKTCKRNFLGPNLDQNQAQNQVFDHFLKFSSLVFLKIAQDDSLEHLVQVKPTKNILGPQIGSEIIVSAILSRLHHQFFLILHKIAAWGNI